MQRGSCFIIGLLFFCFFLPFPNQPVFQKTPFPIKVEAQTDAPCEVWRPTFVSDLPAYPPLRRSYRAVWTGTEMLIWGGDPTAPSGTRYNPVTCTWKPMSQINAPEKRQEFTAVWTGTEMIVWGGRFREEQIPSLDTGGRYNPVTDTWTSVSTTNAPSSRAGHCAVWTGKEMIVWGGTIGNLTGKGGRYNPFTDSWMPISHINEPTNRIAAHAFWTGTEMLIWGGQSPTSGGASPVTGGLYNPVRDAWYTIFSDGAPLVRDGDSAVWTGKEMIIWGGFNPTTGEPFDTGFRFHPKKVRWLPISQTGAPLARHSQIGVWMGERMLIWGGSAEGGALYDPETDSWSPCSTDGAGQGTQNDQPVWTGKELLFGEHQMAHYHLRRDRWKITSAADDAPRGMAGHTAVWDGSEMIVWGDQGGKKYDPVSNHWKPISQTNAPTPRFDHSAVWTGQEMLVWGGRALGQWVNSGARYNPSTDTWVSLSQKGAPSPRSRHTAIWTGQVMIVWGGTPDYATTYFNDGGIYDPGTDTWTPLEPTLLVPERSDHVAFWTGKEMLIFGGRNRDAQLANGARYNPETKVWLALPTENAPAGHTAATWTGKELLVLAMQEKPGSADPPLTSLSRKRYNPDEDRWSSINADEMVKIDFSVNQPTVWTGTEMIVGGEFAYHPATDRWRRLPLADYLNWGCWGITSLWTGSEVIVWGGGQVVEPGLIVRTGGRFRPCPD